jgi:hypothetical protein
MKRLALLLLASLLGCGGGGGSSDAGADAEGYDLPPSYRDLPPVDLRPLFDVFPDGPPTFLGVWSYDAGMNTLACANQDASTSPSSGQLFISPAPGGGLDVEDAGCHVHFVVEGNVATASPPAQQCRSNTTPANWTLTLQDDGTLREVIVGSIQVANASCFIDGMSTLGRL